MKKRRLYAFETEEKARRAVEEEVNNWTWLDRDEKDRIVAEAEVTEGSNRFGPIFDIEFKTS